MDATVLLTTLIFFLSGSGLDQTVGNSIAETPAIPNLFIEVDLAEPTTVEPFQFPTGTALPAVADPLIDRSIEIQIPIGQEGEPPDQIEPLFVDEVDAVIDEESPPVETPLLDREKEGLPLLEQNAIMTDSAESTIVDEDWTGLDAIGEPATAPNADPRELVPQAAKPDDLITSDAPSFETAEPLEHDADSLNAIEPIVLEDLMNLPEPQPEFVEEPADAQAPTNDSPFVQSLPVVEPELVRPTERASVPDQDTAEVPDSSPVVEFNETATEIIEAVESVMELLRMHGVPGHQRQFQD